MNIISDKVKIVFITDSNYFKNCLVSLLSLIENTKKNIAVKIILTEKIDTNLNDYMCFFCQYSNLHLEFILDIEKYDFNFKNKNHVSKSAFCKIYLSEILHYWDHVIYLDSDILVKHDIGELWNLKNEDILQAVYDPEYDYDNEVMGLPKKCKTFNSGVMLMNLKKMRLENTSSSLANFLIEKNHLTKLNDQAAFNAVFYQKWGQLPLQWNVQTVFFTKKYSNIDKITFKKITIYPYILHFTTHLKPWKLGSAHPFKSEYIFYYKKIFVTLKYKNKCFYSLLQKTKQKYNIVVTKIKYKIGI